MTSTIRRPSLAVWQLRLRDRRRRARLGTALVLVLVVVAAEVRLERSRAGSATVSEATPVAEITGDGPGPDPGAPTADGGSDGDEVGPDGEEVGPDGLATSERAVAISSPLAVPTLSPGDRVEIVTIGLDATGQARADTVGDPMRVIGVDDDAIVLAVPTALVEPLLAAQAAGPIEAVRLP